MINCYHLVLHSEFPLLIPTTGIGLGKLDHDHLQQAQIHKDYQDVRA